MVTFIYSLIAETDATSVETSVLISSAHAYSPVEIASAVKTNAQGWAASIPASFAADPQYAMSTIDYPVTPGDIFSLAFIAGDGGVSYTITLDTSYKIRVVNFGLLDVKGKTFREVKRDVENLVQKNYPLSGVQFVLQNPGTFKVLVKGEVAQTAEMTCWGLSRLSTVIAQDLTSASSIRDVQITSASGKTATYDIFKAIRFGDLSQDPFVRSGDVVTIKRAIRTISVTGSVMRPGYYQLLRDEGLSELVNYYGGGLTPLADSDRIAMVRYLDATTISGNKIFLNKQDIDTNYPLEDYDSVTISDVTDLLPVMFIEGAVKAPTSTTTTTTTTTAELQTSSRQTIRFNPGENYANLVRQYQSYFSAVSDTSNAYIIRGDQHILMNLNPMLYDATYRSEYYVEANDILIIPFRQYFVSVSGAVKIPGRYPYIPDRDVNYYIGLAGGFNPQMNSRKAVSIHDVAGNKLKRTAYIPPEANIDADTNAFLYYFNQYAPVLTTTMTIVLTYLSLKATLAAQ